MGHINPTVLLEFKSGTDGYLSSVFSVLYVFVMFDELTFALLTQAIVTKCIRSSPIISSNCEAGRIGCGRRGPVIDPLSPNSHGSQQTCRCQSHEC